MKPTLSVIIPTYNRASYLRNCVNSVLKCGVDDLEVIIVDDGSTDDTAAVVSDLSGPVRYVRQANAGPAAARHRGVQVSRGRYIAFLDSDDLWQPGTCGAMVGLLAEYPNVGLVFAHTMLKTLGRPATRWMGEATLARLGALASRQPRPNFFVFDPGILLRTLSEASFLCMGSWVVRRELYDRLGGFDLELRRAEDRELSLRAVCNTAVGFWQQPLVIYHEHGEERLTDDYDQCNIAYCRALEKVLKKCLGLPSEDRDWLRRLYRKYAFYSAYPAYDRGDLATARDLFGRALRHGGWRGKALGYWFLCLLPGVAVRRFREIKQWLSHAAAPAEEQMAPGAKC